MTPTERLFLRLQNQQLISTSYTQPEEIVGWFGAMQAQDYSAVRWAIGLRLPHTTDNVVEQALSDGKIMRIHIMRPTWHLVTATDIHALLTLTASRVHAINAYYSRKLGLDKTFFTKSTLLLQQALQHNNHLTRLEIISQLKQGGIHINNLGYLYLLLHAELEGIICNGIRRGKQTTYALLNERVPHPILRSYDESLALFTKKYFTSHGPATLQDFAWWSGLTQTEAKRGIDMIIAELESDTDGDKTYWFSPSHASINGSTRILLCLPNYDEYIVGYTDRNAIFNTTYGDSLDARKNILFNHTILLDGKVVGTWKRVTKKKISTITPYPFITFSDKEQDLLMTAIHNYEQFFLTR